MTRKEAAMCLVNMACILRDKGGLDYNSTKMLNEAVVMACAELMIDEILDERAKLLQEEDST